MREGPLFYYITDRLAFPGDDRTRRFHLLDKITEAVSHSVDYIQLREKDLSSHELEGLAREAVHIIREMKSQNRALRTALLINSRADVALVTGADVHLRSDDISPEDVRTAWKLGSSHEGDFARENPDPIIAVSCHSAGEVAQAAATQATFAVFAPVFEKKTAPNNAPSGLEALRQACGAEIPVLALGGLTIENAASCLQAGAAGIAAIRLFQENDIATVVQALRR
ncbi:MAG: thiamine-phosphate diphosphorylase [Candidatus Sulfotelmatobacter sp.]|nr:thiamine-phosphate diphosphorylase [Candidatus Sulfotelmatobacter sp.]